MLNPGRLDTRCTFYEDQAVSDGMGAWTHTWAPLTSSPAWCKFEPLKGLEQIEAAKVQAGHHAKITIRRCRDLCPAHKVDILSERWNITAIQDYNREGFMICWIHRTE